MKNFLKRIFSKASVAEEKQEDIPEKTIREILSVTDCLILLNEWLERHAPELQSNLNEPVITADLEEFEAELGIELPADLKEAYSIYNGEITESDGLFGLWRWLSLDDLELEFSRLSEFEDSEKLRIPFLLSPGGDILYVESGAESQVMEWWHESPARDVRHDSFQEFLNEFVNRLFSGGYVYDAKELSGLIDKSEL